MPYLVWLLAPSHTHGLNSVVGISAISLSKTGLLGATRHEHCPKISLPDILSDPDLIQNLLHLYLIDDGTDI